MWKYVILVVAVLFCMVLIVGTRIKSKPQELPFQDESQAVGMSVLKPRSSLGNKRPND